jgi:hypothetical protein
LERANSEHPKNECQRHLKAKFVGIRTYVSHMPVREYAFATILADAGIDLTQGTVRVARASPGASVALIVKPYGSDRVHTLTVLAAKCPS